MVKKEASKSKGSEPVVSVKQRTAIALRIEGITVACICEELEINECTYYRWLKKKPFREAQEEYREEVFSQMRDRTIGFLNKALNKLGKELDEKGFSASAVSLMLSFYSSVGVFHEHMTVQQELKRLKDELGSGKEKNK